MHIVDQILCRIYVIMAYVFSGEASSSTTAATNAQKTLSGKFNTFKLNNILKMEVKSIYLAPQFCTVSINKLYNVE